MQLLTCLPNYSQIILFPPFGLPKKTDADKQARTDAIQAATLYAAQVPLHTMKESFRVFEWEKIL